MVLQEATITKRAIDTLFVTSTALLILVGALITFDIMLSNLNIYLQGVNEIGPIIAIWITFLALPSITIEGQHVRIDFFYKRFPDRLQYLLKIFIYSIYLISLVIIFISALETAVIYGVNKTPNLSLPVYIIYIPLMVGTGVTLIYYAEQGIRWIWT